MLNRRRFTARTIALATSLSLGLTALIAAPLSAFSQDKVTVFAAASLKNALDDISALWGEKTGKKAVISYAGSSALARQIEEGAPADIFISADRDWMAYLSQKNLINKKSEVELLGNRIVLIAPAGTAAEIEIAPGFDLASALGDEYLAMANVDAVPAGKYGKAALSALRVWNEVEGKVAQAENVRAALALVATGEAPFGIVYQTDAAADDKVKIVAIFPEDTHPLIIYPAALTAETTAKDAANFLTFLNTQQARELFEKQGFTVLAPVN